MWPFDRPPQLWEEYGSGEPMCSWCGARSTEEWAKFRDEDDADCSQCHFAPKPVPVQTLVADPPWRFSDSLPGNTRGASNQYPTMTVAEIEAFPLPPLAPDARLFLWRVASMVDEAMRVVRAWGFKAKTELVWIKTTQPFAPPADGMLPAHATLHFGMGRTVRASHETCIIATRGRPPLLNRSVRSVFLAPVFRHSQKPEAFYGLVERLSPGPYVELFARHRRPGWTCYGNELERAAPEVAR